MERSLLSQMMLNGNPAPALQQGIGFNATGGWFFPVYEVPHMKPVRKQDY